MQALPSLSKMQLSFFLLAFTVIASCGSNETHEEIERKHCDTIEVEIRTVDTVLVEQVDGGINNANLIIPRLPDWFVHANVLDGLTLSEDYIFDNRLNPLYLEADFNGDDQLDIAIPIKHASSEKVGFAIVHGATLETFIVGAGVLIDGGLSDNLDYADIWKINRRTVNEPGLDENGEINQDGPLHLSNPSLEIAKSDLGGGQIYWDGNKYVYFHQTC